MFWPEMPEQRARRALNEAVLRLRKRLGIARLRTDGDGLLLADEALEVDAIRFAAAAKGSPEDAAPLLRGDFLEGFSVAEAPAFEEWARGEADRYRALGMSVLVTIAERLLAANHFTQAVDVARRALSYGPYSEPAMRIIIRAAALNGDSGTALGSFMGFVTRLEKELGERPSAGLTALVERIRRQHERRETFPETTEPPLVGRQILYREAFEVVAHGLAGGPRTLFITGLPGMGRSRLVDETLKRGALDGALGVLARPLETDQDAPWSTLRLLLRGGLTDAPGLAGSRPDALSALAGVLPELRDRFSPRAVADVADMAAALASVLGAIAEERPIAVAVDDAHWADGNSLTALAAALRQLRNARVALVVSAAQGVGEPTRDLLHLKADVGRGLPGVAVRLDALVTEDLGTLVRALAPWCRDETDVDRLTRRIAFETGGNPFFAVTLLNALARATTFRADLVEWPPAHGTFDASLPFSIPSLVRLAIAVRVSELSKEDQGILRAASVVGQVLDLDVIAFVSERSLADVERAVPAFERSGFVAFDGQRYVFTAPLVREVVRTECLPRGELYRLERRAVDALSNRADLESRAVRAGLLAHVEGNSEALQTVLAVTREALDSGAMRLARSAFATADRLARDLNLDRADLNEFRRRLQS